MAEEENRRMLVDWPDHHLPAPNRFLGTRLNVLEPDKEIVGQTEVSEEEPSSSAEHIEALDAPSCPELLAVGLDQAHERSRFIALREGLGTSKIGLSSVPFVGYGARESRDLLCDLYGW